MKTFRGILVWFPSKNPKHIFFKTPGTNFKDYPGRIPAEIFERSHGEIGDRVRACGVNLQNRKRFV